MSQRPYSVANSNVDTPIIPNASIEPVPVGVQHHLAAARHKRRISLRPHRLSVSSALSKNNDSLIAGSKSRRRRGVELEVTDLEPEPECVIRTDVCVADRTGSQDDETKDLYEWAILYENQRGWVLLIFIF